MPFSLPADNRVHSSGQPPHHPVGSQPLAEALLVQADLPHDLSDRDSHAEEFAGLAVAAGISANEPVLQIRLRTPSASTLIGEGRLAELAEQVRERGLPLAIFNNHLKPGQERNIEQRLGCRVLDRTGLILDIFSRRAHSHAGRLQVELAQLQHLASRLQRGWSHLERQKGGIGLRGPGEAQLETDRRLIGRRIKKLKGDLSKLRKQRRLSLRRRERNRTPLVALVGYTNAGKSTLLNALTDEEVPTADRLFETLDTSMRRWQIGLASPVVLADTVGFISDLPHRIIEAFHATLEGIAQADLLLIVEEHNNPRGLDHRRAVQRVLAEIGADNLPALTVLNKIDQGEDVDILPGVIHPNEDGSRPALIITVSARNKTGLQALTQAVASRLAGGAVRPRPLLLSPQQGALRSKLYDRGIVRAESVKPDGTMRLTVLLSDTEYEALRRAPAKPSAAKRRGGLRAKNRQAIC